MSDRRRTKITKEILEKEDVSADEKKKCLNTVLYHSYKNNPFMGAILQSLNIMYSHMIPTAGICFNTEAKRWDMYINPFFFCKRLDNVKYKNIDKNLAQSAGDLARSAVLMHELSHITNKHPMRVPFLKISPRKRQLMNIAADMAINQFIKFLPTGCSECPEPFSGEVCKNEGCPGKCIMVEDFYDEAEDGKRIPWEKGKTMEYYYEKLLTRLDDPDKDDGDGDGNAGGGTESGDLPETIDEHMWDASGEEKDMLEATEDLIKRAMIKNRFSYDELPGSIKELLEDIKARKAELNYRALILAAVKRSASGHERKHSWTKKSRRFGYMAPGTKVGDLPKLHFHIDSSGSISVEEANEFLEIMDNFLRVGCRKCRFNLFHTSTYHSDEYKLGTRVTKDVWQSGGTCLESTMHDIAKRQPDLAVILTDGYFSDVDVSKMLPQGVKFPQCLFIISRGGDDQHPLRRLGQTIKIPNSGEQV